MEEKTHKAAEHDVTTPGSMNDDSVIRGIITQAIKSSGLSRAQIAEQMSYLLGERVTERMLDSYTASSMEKHRWPLQYSRAFCSVTHNWRLVQCVAELAGFTVIDQDDLEVLELGRQYLRRKSAEEAMGALERSLNQKGLK